MPLRIDGSPDVRCQPLHSGSATGVTTRHPYSYSYSYSIETSETPAFRWVSLPDDATEGSGDLVRERNLVDRETIDIEWFIIECRFCHHAPFEYEYRCTEYEYDHPDERSITSIISARHRSGRRPIDGCRRPPVRGTNATQVRDLHYGRRCSVE